MSLVADRIRQIEAQLDQLQLVSDFAVSSPSRVAELQLISKSLSGTLDRSRLRYLIDWAALQNDQDLEWMVAAKATTQTYAIVLNRLIDQTLPLSNGLWYWDEILGSQRSAGLYVLQTSPMRLWSWGKEIYHEVLHRQGDAATSWTKFYGLVKESIQERSLANLQRLSPVSQAKTEAVHNKAALRKLRELSASGLGVLMDNCLDFDDDWKPMLEKSVSLMAAVMDDTTALDLDVSAYEEQAFAAVIDVPEISVARLSDKLKSLLDSLPEHAAAYEACVQEYGQPSFWVRYWPAFTLAFFTGGTTLRILLRRKADVVTWIRDFGSTAADFWYNWVIEPTKKIIGTIRHDKDSEIAIMSKESLKGDMNSLERMVVDFAVDNPVQGKLSDAQISDLRGKVKEGDLTPVLRVYERDMRRPFMGAVRGELVRALLIQVQKTKVDVEVVVSGIDAILKSQELVFGFVGLTPGVIVCIGVYRWLSGVYGGDNYKKATRQGKIVRVLRNIDRILTAAKAENSSVLSYKDHGLLLCEIHVLRQLGSTLLPGDINREFVEELADLTDMRAGIERQLRVVDRLRWAYKRWLRT